MHSLIRKLCIVAALVAGPLSPACNGQITATWDPSPSAAVAGYYLCWGTGSGAYTFTNSYPASTSAGSVHGLLTGQTYFFAVQAFANDGSVSPFSNEQSIMVDLDLTNSASSGLQSSTDATNSASSSLQSSTGATNSASSGLQSSSSATNSGSSGLQSSTDATNSSPTDVKSPGVQSTLKSNSASTRGVVLQDKPSAEPEPTVSAPLAPTTALSFSPVPPMILSAGYSGNQFIFTWSTTANQMYRIQYTTNLVQNVWADLGDAIIATGSSASVSNTVSNLQMFYRASLIPQ